MAREVYTGVPLAPQIIEDIKKMTSDCPNVYFGTPDYPIPAVSCGMGCEVLKGECKKLPKIQQVPASVTRAARFIKQQRA